MKKSITVYVENDDELIKLKALLITLDLSFKECETACKNTEEVKGG